ncbi:MAG: AmiS/UreI family transporter [Oscillospiraceae bacterium]|nr:AmiS/UreI family transporter [Oscillospiraceae bacterium]
MLGVNLLFAGFALTLNGVAYLTSVDEKAKGTANVLVGVIIAINAVFQTAQAVDHTTFGFAAAMWLFALNYFIIAAHIFFKSTNWKAFGLYGLFASIVSFVFTGEAIITGAPWVLVYMWAMWGILWAQSFFASMLGIKAIDKLSPHILILNGIASTFVPGFLILLGVIL